MSDLLKSVIQDLINDRQEQAQVTIHEYLVGKTQEIAGLTEAESSCAWVVIHGELEKDNSEGTAAVYRDFKILVQCDGGEEDKLKDIKNFSDKVTKAIADAFSVKRGLYDASVVRVQVYPKKKPKLSGKVITMAPSDLKN